MVTSTIFFRKVYRLFIISIFIPSHEDTIFIEREPLELSMFIDLNRCLSLIQRTSDILTFFRHFYDTSIKKQEVFISITKEIFIFIDLQE